MCSTNRRIAAVILLMLLLLLSHYCDARTIYGYTHLNSHNGILSCSNKANGRITGVVIEEKYRTPIHGALVQIIDTEYFTVSDSSGFFSFSKIPADTYELSARKPQYSPRDTVTVRITDEDTLVQNIILRLVRISPQRPKYYSVDPYFSARGYDYRVDPDITVLEATNAMDPDISVRFKSMGPGNSTKIPPSIFFPRYNFDIQRNSQLQLVPPKSSEPKQRKKTKRDPK